MDPPAEHDSRRATTTVDHHGERVAILVHDPSLLEDPELVHGVCAAAGLSLSNQRLQAQLRARLLELQESRARIVEVGDAERRRLERDLHDGAQQRLVSLALDLSSVGARVRGDPETAALVAVNGSVRIEVTDDGVGGARMGTGSGLTGLADRI